jgi:hypothetical protein
VVTRFAPDERYDAISRNSTESVRAAGGEGAYPSYLVRLPAADAWPERDETRGLHAGKSWWFSVLGWPVWGWNAARRPWQAATVTSRNPIKWQVSGEAGEPPFREQCQENGEIGEVGRWKNQTERSTP